MPGQLIYSFVARDKVVLAEFTSFSGNFSAIAVQCLETLPPENNKFTFPHGNHTLNFLIENGFAYMVLSDQDVTRQVNFGFLERVKADFQKKYGTGERVKKAGDKGLNREYAKKLEGHMQFVMENPGEVSKLAKIQSQVAEVKGIMKENIDKVLQRGEKMESLVEKTDNLKSQANLFKKQGSQIRQKMWYENMKVKLAIFGIFIVLGLIIWLSVCGGITCQ